MVMEIIATLKQTRFVNEYLETGNATEAAMRAYNPHTRATARAIGSENLAKPNIRDLIDNTLIEEGLTPKLVICSLVQDIQNKPANRISELLLASKILGLLDRIKKEDKDAVMPIPIFGGHSQCLIADKEKIPASRNTTSEDL
jgi:hypothetical protein